MRAILAIILNVAAAVLFVVAAGVSLDWWHGNYDALLSGGLLALALAWLADRLP